MTNTGAIIAGIKLRRERGLVRLLREQRAVSASEAVAIDKQSGLTGAAFRMLLRNQAIVEARPGYFWLDEKAYADLRSKRAMLIFAVAVVAMAVVGIAVWAASRPG